MYIYTCTARIWLVTGCPRSTARIDHVLVATAKSRYTRTLTSEAVNDSYLICGDCTALIKEVLSTTSPRDSTPEKSSLYTRRKNVASPSRTARTASFSRTITSWRCRSALGRSRKHASMQADRKACRASSCECIGGLTASQITTRIVIFFMRSSLPRNRSVM